MFRKKLFLAIALVLVSTKDISIAETPVDYWAKTSISADHLKNYLTQSRCYSDEDSFLGCIEAINLLFYNSRTQMLLTNDVTQKQSGMKETLLEVEGLQVKKYVSPKVSDAENFLERYKEKLQKLKESNESWKNLYHATKEKPLSIENLISSALSSIEEKDKKSLSASAINEYLKNTIDPHTYIIPQEEVDSSSSASQNSYVGIGVFLKQRGNELIAYPMENSPALKAGLRYMDVITHIDGTAIKDIKMKDASSLIMGEEKSTVTLKVKRENQILDIKVTRGKIVTKNIEAKLIKDFQTDSKIGYIKVHSFFVSGLCKKFLQLAKTLKAGGAQSLVLDLRNNGGGSLAEALCMASSYIDENEIILIEEDPKLNLPMNVFKNSEELGKNLEMPHFPKGPMLYELYDKKPLVVLINAISASASELLPGAIQAHDRVVTVGERTFGKGTIQVRTSTKAVGLPEIEGVVLYRTQSRFHFANRQSNQLTGIIPDIEVYQKPKPTEDDKFAFREADLYPNAISSSKPYQGISEEYKNRISDCLKKRNNILSKYNSSKYTAIGPDLQLSTAREVAACL